MGDRIVVVDAPNVQTIEHCLGQVRWNGAVLEQAWEVKRIHNGPGGSAQIISVDMEWRPVPQK